MAAFSVDGFTWEASFSRAQTRLATRAEALTQIMRVGPRWRCAPAFAAAWAAYKVADYSQAVRCALQARQAGLSAREAA